jgi:putative transcriptional regulator
MTNCESVKLSALEKICKELDCNFGDLVDYVPDEEEK